MEISYELFEKMVKMRRLTLQKFVDLVHASEQEMVDMILEGYWAAIKDQKMADIYKDE